MLSPVPRLQQQRLSKIVSVDMSENRFWKDIKRKGFLLCGKHSGLFQLLVTRSKEFISDVTS